MSKVEIVMAKDDFWVGHRFIKRGETFRYDHDIPKLKPKMFVPFRDVTEMAVAGGRRR